MTQEDKQLLLRALGALLPYGVIVKYKSRENEGIVEITCSNIVYVTELGNGWWKECKPYLRSMSSMTDEEFKELTTITELQYDQLELRDWGNGCKTLEFYLSEIPHYCVIKVFDWLNAHHFDCYGLIEKGLAIDCTGLHIYD